LKGLRNLEWLALFGKITDADLKKAKDELPNVKVWSVDREADAAAGK
jgi:DNA-directed RNA polymerase subunit F